MHDFKILFNEQVPEINQPLIIIINLLLTGSLAISIKNRDLILFEDILLNIKLLIYYQLILSENCRDLTC